MPQNSQWPHRLQKKHLGSRRLQQDRADVERLGHATGLETI